MKLLKLAIAILFLQIIPSNQIQTHTYSVGYIFLDGKKLDKAKIDKLRTEIISQYNSGETFKNLAKKYNMDGNLKCDKFEFMEEEVVPEFAQSVKGHKVNEIFIVDVPYNKWYYVVLRNPDSN